jgi:hypothetical protein
MEHYKVSMAVHISPAVCELIYGDRFLVEHRASAEVKGNRSYLIS